ncbi:MAG: hypothetical protein K1X75_17590 [Leptospirales bacterium]|nr:hypothetical protein [Leptospirales bacterium]
MPAELEQMLRILRAGPLLECESPWLRDHPQQCREIFGVETSELRFCLERDGRQIADGPLQAGASLRADLSAEPHGALQLTLYASRSEGRRVLWRQQIYVQPSLQRSPAAIDALARRHAPVFLCSAKEQYFPVALGDLFESEPLREGANTVRVQSIFGERQIAAPLLDDFLRYNGHQDYLLDQSFFDFGRSSFKDVHGEARRSVVYYSYMEEGDRFFLHYHTFYAFDPKTGIARLLNVGPHIFDRESMTLCFDASEKLLSITLSGHLEGQPILFLEKLKIWNTGRVRIDLPDSNMPQIHGHFSAAVAEGSHAIYPCAGLYHISALTELAGHIIQRLLPLAGLGEEQGEELVNHQVLLPPDLQSDRFSSYELRPLRLDLLRSDPLPPQTYYDPATATLCFSGYWVDVPGFHNERFPPFSSREQRPGEWCDQAYRWDWSDLPASILQHNRALAQSISEASRKAGP